MTRNAFLIISKELAADKRITVTARLLFAQLADHCNKSTGQCNPWVATLAKELGLGRCTIMRGLKRLQAAGFLVVKRTQRGNQYEFPKSQSETSQVSNRDFPKSHSETPRGPHPLYEPYIREQNVSAPKRAAASPSAEIFSNAAPGPLGVPRKDVGWETFLERLPRGRLMNRSEWQQFGWAMVFENNRRRNGG